MVHQVRIVAVLNAVQGGLELLMGMLTAGMGVFFQIMLQIEKSANPGQPRAASDPPEAFYWLMAAMYGALGLAVLTGGILRLAACVQNFRFQGRTLGFVSIIGGMASVLSCYCAPTAIAILVYGLIVLLNPAVTMAFAMRKQGYSVDEILAAFMPYPPVQYPPPVLPAVGEPPGG
jgi:hypothetical protein